MVGRRIACEGRQRQVRGGLRPGAALDAAQIGGGQQLGHDGFALGGEPGALAGVHVGRGLAVAGSHPAAQHFHGAALAFGMHAEVRAAHGGVARRRPDVERAAALARGVGFDAAVPEQEAGVQMVLAVVGAQPLQPHLGGRRNAQARAVGQGDDGGTVRAGLYRGAFGNGLAIMRQLAVQLHLVGGRFQQGLGHLGLEPAGQHPERGAWLQMARVADVVELLHVAPALGGVELFARQAQQRVAGLDVVEEDFVVGGVGRCRRGGRSAASRGAFRQCEARRQGAQQGKQPHAAMTCRTAKAAGVGPFHGGHAISFRLGFFQLFSAGAGAPPSASSPSSRSRSSR